MTYRTSLSRRSFLATSAAAYAATAAARAKQIPVGLELYSVRDVLKDNLMGVLKGVAKMGYAGVEFFAPYYEWTPDYAREVRKQLDDLGMRCFSTHNGPLSFSPDGIDKAIELNKILGSGFIVFASAGHPAGLDGWRQVAAQLTSSHEKMKSAGMRAGYHNHQLEFKPVEGTRPIEILANNTPADLMLQLDVGTCLEAGSDPVEWINQNPGRIASVHCKDWSKDPSKGYRVLFGEGVADWKKIFQAAEKKGGVEYYLIEQEGSALPSMETVEQCLKSFKQIHG